MDSHSIYYDQERMGVIPYTNIVKDITLEPARGLDGERTPYFFFAVDGEGRPYRIIGNFQGNIDYYQKIFQLIYSEAWFQTETRYFQGVKGEGEMTLQGRTWLYASISFGDDEFYTEQGTRYTVPSPFAIIAFVDVTSYKAQLSQLALTLVCTGLAALAALFLISLLISNRAIRPVKESWLKQKQFVADASHELKTPLAAICATVDAIETNAEETVLSQAEWFSNIRADLLRMNKLTADLLYLAQAEDAEEEVQAFDLSEACETVIAATEALLYDRSIVLESRIEKGVCLEGSRERIMQALPILLDNAAKYADEGGRVTVALRQLKGLVELSVQNTGETIPLKDLPRIFDRFYRSDPSRAEEKGGFGLGLAIARAIVERAGGRITAASVAGLTTFSITFKR